MGIVVHSSTQWQGETVHLYILVLLLISCRTHVMNTHTQDGQGESG